VLELRRLKLINKELVLNRTKVKNKCHRLGIIARHKRYPQCQLLKDEFSLTMGAVVN
jgi:hypothetical protein